MSAPGRILEVGLAVACLVALTAQARPAADLTSIEGLIQKGQYLQAERELRSLPSASGSSEYLLGFTLIQLYRFEEAEQSLRRAVEDRPEDVDRLRALAKSLLEQGKNVAAIEVLDRALAVESRPDLHFARAMCALNAGRTEEAERDLELSLEGESRNAEALYKLGHIAMERGDYRKARARLAQSLELDSRHLEARFSLGLAELRTGEPEGAIVAFEQVLAVVPGHVGALYNLARAHQLSGRKDEARSTLERFESMSAAQDEADFLMQAVKKNPSNVEGRLALIRKLLELGQADSALQEALVVRQQAPRRADAYRLLAESFDRLGRGDDARRAEEFARRLEVGE
jgi:tetratricopeptide (TPR) repeat protein